MKPTSILNALLVLAVLAGVDGCTRRDEPIGPAQKAGKAVDDAGAQVADKLHDQLDKANEAAAQVTRAADETRDKIKDATEDAGRGLDKATEEVGKKVERAGEKIQDAAH
jgi:ABC-type transporter Mla subunit MlaD